MGSANEVSAAAAAASAIPSDLPPYCVNWARLIGQVVIQKSGAAFTTVSSAFGTTYQLSAATSHANLSSLDFSDGGHTGTANSIASFDATGAAREMVASAATTDLDRFLVDSVGNLKYRTGAQMLTDIAAIPSADSSKFVRLGGRTGGQTIAQKVTFSYDTASLQKAFFPSGGVINWTSGDVTLTHSSKRLTVDGILLVDSTFRAMNNISAFSLEAGKTEHFVRTDVSDADLMRIFAYDNTGSAYKPLWIGGLAGATSGLKIDADATVGNLTSSGFAVTGLLSATKAYYNPRLVLERTGSLTQKATIWPNNGGLLIAVDTTSTNYISIGLLSGNITATGAMQADQITIDPSAYAATWDGNVTAPTRDDIYDKIESMGGTYTVKMSLSNAQVLALDTSPLEVIANPGSGKAIWVDASQSFIRVNYASSAFNCAGGINIYYNGGTMSDGYQCATAPISVASTMVLGFYTNTLGTRNIALDNVSMLVGLPASVSSGGGTIDVYLVYRIVTL